MFTQLRRREIVRRVVSTLDAAAHPHGFDRYVEQFVPTWSSTEVRGRVTQVDRSADGSVVLTIAANGNWSGFRAGQYTQLSVEIDGARHTRCYSMANAADGGRTLQLGIKAHPHGLVSRHLVATATVGMIVGLTPAAGEFHLPDTRPDHVLLVSGGSGITPVLSMARTLVAEGHAGRITFLHYAMTPEAMLFADELAALERAGVAVVTRFGQQFLDATHLDDADPGWHSAETFVCGPAPLMAAVESLCAADRFHQEAFTLPQFVGEAGDVGGSLRFGAAAIEVANDGTPILAQAEAAGLTPKSGCRMGICHTCVRSLSCGSVRNAVTGELTSATTGATPVRVCVSVPVGDIAIDL